MTEWQWPDLAAPTDEQWEAIKTRLPIGCLVDGVVVARQPFGVFLDVGGALALLELPSLPGAGERRLDEPDNYPSVGTVLCGYVVGHRDRGRQVRLASRSPQGSLGP